MILVTIAANHFALFDGVWKLIEFADGTASLFHLENDPGETTDLAEEQPAMTRLLRGKLAELKAVFPPSSARGNRRPTRN